MFFKCCYKPCGWRGIPTFIKGRPSKDCPKCGRPTARREA